MAPILQIPCTKSTLSVFVCVNPFYCSCVNNFHMVDWISFFCKNYEKTCCMMDRQRLFKKRIFFLFIRFRLSVSEVKQCKYYIDIPVEVDLFECQLIWMANEQALHAAVFSVLEPDVAYTFPLHIQIKCQIASYS